MCSTFTEHEVQNGLEERDSCTVNTILPYVVRQNPSVEQTPATCHSDDNHSNASSSGILEQRPSCSVNTIQPYVVQQNPSVAQTPAACPSDNNHPNLYSNSGISIGWFLKVEGKGVKCLSISHVMEMEARRQ